MSQKWETVPTGDAFTSPFPLIMVLLPPPLLLARHIPHCHLSKRQIWCLSQCWKFSSGFLLSAGHLRSPFLQWLCCAMPIAPPKPPVPLHIRFPNLKSQASHMLTPANAFSSFKTYMTSHLCNAIFHVGFLSLLPVSTLSPSPSTFSTSFLPLSPLLFSQIKSIVTMILYENLYVGTDFTVLQCVCVGARVHTSACKHMYILACTVQVPIYPHYQVVASGGQECLSYLIFFISSIVSLEMLWMNLMCSNICMCS